MECEYYRICCIICKIVYYHDIYTFQDFFYQKRSYTYYFRTWCEYVTLIIKRLFGQIKHVLLNNEYTLKPL